MNGSFMELKDLEYWVWRGRVYTLADDGLWERVCHNKDLKDLKQDRRYRKVRC